MLVLFNLSNLNSHTWLVATTLDDIALYRLQHPVSGHFQTDRVSPECNSQPFPGQLSVTTGLLLFTSDQIRTLPTARTGQNWGEFGGPRGGEGAVQATAHHWNLCQGLEVYILSGSRLSCLVVLPSYHQPHGSHSYLLSLEQDG